MKYKTLPVVGIMILQCFLGGAHAQSSMTVSGVIDNGITYTNNAGGKSSVSAQDGIQRSNKLGFQGNEDLGSGRSAIFRLISGFSLNTGASSPSGILFKESLVGLRDKDLGEFTVGRQYDFMVVMQKYLACFECGIYAIENADLNRVAGDYLNNSIKFQSQKYNGFSVGAMYAFGDNAAGFTNKGRAYSFLVRYEDGPFSASVVSQEINGSPLSASSIGAPVVLGVDIKKTPSFDVDSRRITAVGASYALGNLTLAGMYTNTRFQRNQNTATDQLFGFGATYPITPMTLISGMVTLEKLEGAHWYTTTAGISHSLSKSTRTYIDFAYQKAGNNAVASIFKIGPSSSSSQFVTRIGVIHYF